MIHKEKWQGNVIRLSLKDGDKELGRVFLYLIKNDLNDKPYGPLEDLYVEEHARGKGIAKELIKEFLEIAKREKAGLVEHGKEFRINLNL